MTDEKKPEGLRTQAEVDAFEEASIDGAMAREHQRQEIEELALRLDDVQLSKEHGMVTQVWQDGEVTCQKSGDLLWQRTLHCFEPPIRGAKELALVFPHQHGSNSFAYVTSENSYVVRQAIKDMLGDTSIDHMDPRRRAK